jgi:hypothetical protein
MTQNELDSLSSEEKANLQADFVSKIDDLANQIQANKENAVATADDVIRPAAGQTVHSENEYTIAIEINRGSNDIEPTVLEKAVAGIGKAQQAIMALEESNPQAAEAIRIGLGLATGGPVKEAVSYTVEKATEVVANMSETAQQALAKVGEASDYLLNLAGSFIQGSTLDEFKGELVNETQYTEAYSTENGAALGSSPTDIKDGVVLTASTLGIGAGLGSIKKASSHESGPDKNSTTTANASDQHIDVVSPDTRQHILDGDGPGSGGHLWPGQEGKTPFPENWNGDKVIHEVGDIATSPSTKWYAQTGNGGRYTKTGKPAKWVAWETLDGVRVRVVYEPATGRVVTGFPDNDPIPNLKPVE